MAPSKLGWSSEMTETAAIYDQLYRARRRQRRNQYEYYESVKLADWLDRVAKVFFTHIPLGETRDHRERIDKRSGRRIRYSPAGIKLQRMGLRRHIADYFILDSPPRYPRFKGAWIELKAKKEDGGKPPTLGQQEWLNDARKRGYAASWFYGADAAIEWCKQLGWGK